MPSFANQAVTVVHPAWITDARNNRKAVFDERATRVLVQGCSVQPGASAELLAGLGTVTVRWTVLAPVGTAVEATDAVEVVGKRYAVNGEPMRQPSATGALDHVLLLLIDWK